MKSNCIIPIHEIVKILELKPVKFISIVPFFDFSIGLRMINASFDMFDLIFLKKAFKSALCIAILGFLAVLCGCNRRYKSSGIPTQPSDVNG